MCYINNYYAGREYGTGQERGRDRAYDSAAARQLVSSDRQRAPATVVSSRLQIINSSWQRRRISFPPLLHRRVYGSFATTVLPGGLPFAGRRRSN